MSNKVSTETVTRTTLTIDHNKKSITIVMPLEEPRLSKSGNTYLIGGTRGNIQTDAVVNGKPVFVGINAYIYAAEKKK